jgi:hypothetical protein
LESIAMPEAQLGFAIASHYLYLTEGERKVFIRFEMNDNAALDGMNIACYLTAEKEWYKASPDPISSVGKNIFGCQYKMCRDIFHHTRFRCGHSKL